MKRFEHRLGKWHIALEAGRIEPPIVPLGNRYEIGFPDWESAVAASKGYTDADILHKAIAAAREVKAGRAAFERDTVLFTQREIDYPLMTWLLEANRTQTATRILDFGGALGSLYYQHRWLLENMADFRWGVVEQPHVAKAGKEEFETYQLRFFEHIEECLEEISPNFLLLAGVLQYLPEPYKFIDRMLALGLPYVLLHRTMAQRWGPDQIAVQHVAHTIYPGSYPMWLLDATHLESIFSNYGYEVVDCFDPFPTSHFGPEGFESPYQSWFLIHRRQV